MSLLPTDRERAECAEKDRAAFAGMHSTLAKKYREERDRLNFIFEHRPCIGVSSLGGPEIGVHGWSIRGNGKTYHDALDDLMKKRKALEE